MGNQTIGEQLAGLSASFLAFEKYEHDNWHKLANDLTPIMNLPVQIARDFGKLEGQIQERIANIGTNIERTVADAVEKAMEPVSREVRDVKDKQDSLESRVKTLEAEQAKYSNARMLLVWAIQTLIAAASAVAAIVAVTGQM